MNKKKLGRKLLTNEELKIKGLPWYKSEAWKSRRVAIKIRIAKREQPELIKRLGL